MPGREHSIFTPHQLKPSALVPVPKPLEDNTVATSVFNITELASGVRLDATQSTHDNVPTGSWQGRHSLKLAVTRKDLIIDGLGGTSVNLVAGDNVTFDPDSGLFSKSISGNSWNAFVYTDDIVVDPSVGPALVTWRIEGDPDNDGDTGAQGTKREMGGLDNAPEANRSYSSGEHMIYQVNATTAYIYENGSNMGAFPRRVVPGDQYGIGVATDGTVSYYHFRNGVATLLYVSKKKVTGPMKFKGAMNRGNTSSGHSQFEATIQVHTDLQDNHIQHIIEGAATEAVSADDVARLDTMGLVVTAGSRYCDMFCTKRVNAQFPAGTQYDVVHGYSIITNQTQKTF